MCDESTLAVRKVQDPPRPTAAVVQTGNALPQMSRQPVYFGVIRAPQLQIRCLDQIGVCSCGWVPKCVHRAASKRSRNVLRVLEGVTFRGEHTIDIRHAESRFLEELAPACASPANRHHDSLRIFQRSPCLPELTRETGFGLSSMRDRLMAGARSVLLLFAAAWVDVFRGGEAVVTGSNWREHAAATSGGECRGARTRFDVDSEKVCVIELDAGLSADARLAGPVRCFGGFPFDMPPELVGVAFTDVSMGRHHVCALRAASEVDGRQAACWGTVAEPDKFGISSGAPKVSLQNLCSGSYYACGIVARGQGRDDEGQIVCWGESETVRAIAQEAAGRRLQELACGMYAVCAVLENSGLA